MFLKKLRNKKKHNTPTHFLSDRTNAVCQNLKEEKKKTKNVRINFIGKK